jgi:hypothetical protein
LASSIALEDRGGPPCLLDGGTRHRGLGGGPRRQGLGGPPGLLDGGQGRRNARGPLSLRERRR